MSILRRRAASRTRIPSSTFGVEIERHGNPDAPFLSSFGLDQMFV
jgi:hypothetical protein